MVARSLQAQSLHHSAWAKARWLVLAPHADDEVLGCGALIADTARRQKLAGIAFLTDGSGSHHCDTHNKRQRLAALRRHEARAAVRMLSPDAPQPLFLDWRDATPYKLGSLKFNSTVTQLARLCDRLAVDAIAVTGREEPHCDHVAAFEVAAQAVRQASRPTRLFEYIVWAKNLPGPDFVAVRTAAMNVGRRKLALAQHRSQMTPLLGDGFRVPQTMRTMPAYDLLFTRR